MSQNNETRVVQNYSRFGNQSVTFVGERVRSVTEWDTLKATPTRRVSFAPVKPSRKKV